MGIAYNPELLEGQTFESWEDLWDPSLKQEVVLVDSAREVIGMGLKCSRLFLELNKYCQS